MKCPDPVCGQEQPGPVEDYSIPGRTGLASKCTDECEDCYAGFSVMENPEGDFTVTLEKEGEV